jgi:hypothetical protein
MFFEKFSVAIRFMRELDFGRLENVRFACSPDDPHLRAALDSRSIPLRNFAQTLYDSRGQCSFTVLKVQNGLPIHGESEFAFEGQTAVRSHKFG